MKIRKKQYLELIILVAAVVFFTDGAWIYAKANLAQGLIKHSWQETQDHNGNSKPWPWADTWPVARLVLPNDDSMMVMSGTHGEALAFGPGHDSTSQLPGGYGPIIIAGHRDTHFKEIKNLSNGDLIDIEDQHKIIHQYRVSEMTVVDSRVPNHIPTDSQEQLILITCYPFFTLDTGGPLRYVVIANKLIEPKETVLQYSL